MRRWGKMKLKNTAVLMRQAYEVMKLTVRSYHKVLKVARTIADMEEKEEIDLVTLREALGYRVMDKEYWG